MNSTDNNDFSDFLHSQYKEVKESVNKTLDVNQEKYSDKTLIGEGAQKKVYQVYDNSCSRPVAMAILKNASPEEEAQFLREGRITALLEHPNIMPVYENGVTAEGEFYFTMKLVHGDTLQAILNKLKNNDPVYQKTYSIMNLISIFLKVCDALAYAHSKGIIHRDLKPENIHIGEFGEVLLSDWGLANLQFENCDEHLLNDKTLNEIDLKVSLKGQIKGTPGYIAPEILNSKNAYSIQSDIFALGAILHTILTKNVPIEAQSVKECLQKTKLGDFIPFNKDGTKACESVKAICLKALKVDTNIRYQFTNEIIKDIKRFQEGFATEAEDAGFITQLLLFYKRHQKVCNASFIFILLIAIISVLALNSIREKERKSNEILKDLVKTYKEKEKLEMELVPVYQKKAHEAFVNVQLNSAIALIEVAYNSDPENNKTKELYGKMLIAKQDFDRAALFLEGIDKKLFNVCNKYSALQIEGRLSHPQLINFLKEVGTKVENDIAWIYKNILTEEFQLVKDIDKKAELIKAELRFRNKELKKINLSMKIIDDYYYIDLSNNSKLHTALILEKLGPVNVKKLDISNTAIKDLTALKYMKIEEFHVRNSGKFHMKDFSNYYTYLNAEGSKTDFSKYLTNKPIEYLNIHNSPFSNYNVLNSLKKLRTLIITKDKLPAEIRSKLHKDCQVIEK